MRSIAALLSFVAMLTVTPLSADEKNPAHMRVTAGDLMIHHIWSRATPPTAKSGVAYLYIDNQGTDDDVLKSVSSSRAANTMVHETKMIDGVMTMSHVMALTIPAGETVKLEPGGLHVMLMGLHEPLKADASYKLTLTFEKAGAVILDVPILKPGTTLE